VVYAAFFPFGLGAWIAINGLFAELPIYAVRAPEGWAIAAQMSLAVQAANLAPLLWICVQRQLSRQGSRRAGAAGGAAHGAVGVLRTAQWGVLRSSPRGVLRSSPRVPWRSSLRCT
jgi:hypothetical protein